MINQIVIIKKYCFKDIPQNNVFDIHGMRIGTMFKYYQKGIIGFEDLVKQEGNTR